MTTQYLDRPKNKDHRFCFIQTQLISLLKSIPVKTDPLLRLLVVGPEGGLINGKLL